MYIKIQDKSIRYRVSQQEARKLIAGLSVQSQISLSVSDYLKYNIEITTKENQFVYQNNSMTLYINDNKLLKELETRPSKSGIEFEQHINSEIITIALEIDLKDKQ